MNKDEMELEIKKLLKKSDDLKAENIFLLKGQKEIKAHAEKEINELMPYKHKCIRLEEQNNELLTELEMMKKVKQREKRINRKPN